MKKSLFILISISLLFLSFCQQKVEEKTVEKVEVEPLKPLKYTVAEKKESDSSSWKSSEYKIVLDVPGLPSDKQMKDTAEYIWKSSDKDWKAFDVLMYLAEMNVENSAYCRVRFNPNGMEFFTTNDDALKGTRWESFIKKEEKVVSLQWTEREKTESIRLTLENRKKIYLEYTMDSLWKYDDGSDRIPKMLFDKYMKRYNLTKAELASILLEGARKYW